MEYKIHTFNMENMQKRFQRVNKRLIQLTKTYRTIILKNNKKRQTKSAKQSY